MYIYVNKYVYIYIRVNRLCICIYIYIHMYVCVCAHVPCMKGYEDVCRAWGVEPVVRVIVFYFFGGEGGGVHDGHPAVQILVSPLTRLGNLVGTREVSN